MVLGELPPPKHQQYQGVGGGLQQDTVAVLQTLNINETAVERLSSFKYLGVHISEHLSWTVHTQVQSKKARQHLYQLRKFGVSPAILRTFYSSAVESPLI